MILNLVFSFAPLATFPRGDQQADLVAIVAWLCVFIANAIAWCDYSRAYRRAMRALDERFEELMKILDDDLKRVFSKENLVTPLAWPEQVTP